MFKSFTDATARLGGDRKKETAVTPNQITEAQAIYLRKAAAMAILEEFGRFQMEKGDNKLAVLRVLEDQANKTVESLVLPGKMASDIVVGVMRRLYPAVDRVSRVMSTMVSNIKEINKEDPGGDDAGIGLPTELRATVTEIMKFDKVIDESSDLVVEKCGNKFIEMSFQGMKKHLPKDFVNILS